MSIGTLRRWSLSRLSRRPGCLVRVGLGTWCGFGIVHPPAPESGTGFGSTWRSPCRSAWRPTALYALGAWLTPGAPEAARPVRPPIRDRRPRAWRGRGWPPSGRPACPSLVWGTDVLSGTVVALGRQRHQPGGSQLAQDAPDPSCGQIVHGARQRPRHPPDLTVRGRDDLDVHAGDACRSRTAGPQQRGRWKLTCRRSPHTHARPSSHPAAPCAASGTGRPAGQPPQ